MRVREWLGAASDLACSIAFAVIVLGTRPSPAGAVRDAYQAGYDDGRRDGFKVGKSHAEHTLIRDHGE